MLYETSVPTIIDRCQQAVIKSALEPYWEARFEGSSYGFRPGRGAHDAMQKIYCIARAGKSRHWVLDADIKGAFDNIDQEFLLKQIGQFPGRSWLKNWLKAGILEKAEFIPVQSGTPQGGIISPLLANIALHGMEKALKMEFDHMGRIKKGSPYVVVRYADDFVIFAKSEEDCKAAKVIIGNWLADRGLSFSEEKTCIVHLREGFDFLGFNVRHYPTKAKERGYVLLMKPSKDSIKAFRLKTREVWKQAVSWSTKDTVNALNPKIKGWSHYFRTGSSKRTFSKLDHWMWIRQCRYVWRRHPNKYWWWYRKQYWGKIPSRNDKWVFMDKKTGIYLWKIQWTPIKRHVMVKGKNSPDDSSLKGYWKWRQKNKSYYLFLSRTIPWQRQAGLCPECTERLDNGEEILLSNSGSKSHIKEKSSSLLHKYCLQLQKQRMND